MPRQVLTSGLFCAQDKKVKGKIDSRNSLETYVYNSTDKGAGNTPAQPAAISPVKTTAAWPAAGLVVQLPMYSFVIVTATA